MTIDAPNPQLIAFDWGSSRLRAFLLCDGEVLATRESAHGILHLPRRGPEGFAEALAALAGDWLARWPQLPLLACGMVGSAQGWREVPYLNCPADLTQLAAHCLPVDIGPTGTERSLWIVPGVIDDAPGEVPDVMRGEETQIAGALLTEACGAENAPQCFILPGTHSKWAVVVGGRITHFATYLTGELYAVLRAHSILGRLMPEDDVAFDAAAFARGVAFAAQSRPGEMAHQLFSVRTLALAGRLAPDALPDYLSGLLIGHEIVAASANTLSEGLSLIGAPALCARYVQAFAVLGLPAPQVVDNTAPRGLWRLAKAGGFIAQEN